MKTSDLPDSLRQEILEIRARDHAREEMRRLVCKNIRRAVITIIIAVLAMILDIMVMIFSG